MIQESCGPSYSFHTDHLVSPHQRQDKHQSLVIDALGISFYLIFGDLAIWHDGHRENDQKLH